MSELKFNKAPGTRLDGSYGRNEPCPCKSGLKIKRCCTHLLRSVTPADLYANERANNSRDYEYAQTTCMLKALPSPMETNQYHRAKMTCGACHGSGVRDIVTTPIPGRKAGESGLTGCGSCKGVGWYWVSVSDPVEVGSDDQHTFVDYQCSRCGPLRRVYNETTTRSPRSLGCMSSSVRSSYNCSGTMVKVKNTKVYDPDPEFMDTDLFLVEVYGDTLSLVSFREYAFGLIIGYPYSTMDKGRRQMFLDWSNEHGIKHAPPKHMDPLRWWEKESPYFVPVLTDPKIRCYAELYMANDKGSADTSVVYLEVDDRTVFIHESKHCPDQVTVSMENWNEFYTYHSSHYTGFCVLEIPPKEQETEIRVVDEV